MLTDDERAELLEVAVAAVRGPLEGEPLEMPDTGRPRLAEPGASFVTLELGEELLGCIGTLEPVHRLVEDVAYNAAAAAFADPRLPPVGPREFTLMSVKVSVLSPLEPLAVGSEEELLAALHPGVDGLVIAEGLARATFLPAVWDRVRSAREFLHLLQAKAGLMPGHWPPGLRVLRYTTEEFEDPGPRAPVAAAS